MILQSDIRALPIADNSIDLIWTDPPYLKSFLPCYEWLAREAMRVLKPGGFVCAMAGGLVLNKVYRYFDDSGLDYFFEFQQKSNGDAPTVWKHYADLPAYPVVAKSKPILVYSKGPGRPRVGGVHNVFEATSGWSKQFHHWGQDVASARYFIDHFSKVGDFVLDPLIGGGTTAVACKLIGRRFIGGDIDPVALVTTRFRLTSDKAPWVNLPLFAELR